MDDFTPALSDERESGSQGSSDLGTSSAGVSLGRRYEIIRLLGRGGMGEVFLARDTRLGRLVAVKILTTRRGDRVQRFTMEARATARLTHENIVVIHELGEHEGAPYMVLEHLRGKTLRRWLDERRMRAQDDDDAAPVDAGLPPGRIVDLAIPVVRALVCAHEHGIVHRDLKPSNIMLTDTGTIKVLDFGIAKLMDEPDADHAAASFPDTGQAGAPAITGAHALLGTKPYMSPEQWNEGPVDHRADIWAVGVILAELALGRHPLSPLSALTLAGVGALHVPMPSVREACPELGKLGSIIDRCLIKRREDRLGSARELLDELSALAPAARRPADEGGEPYPGLSAFREADAARFFGRNRAIAEAVTRLSEQPLLAVVGPSGAGKSSFVRAGVVPALRRSGDAWEAFVVCPGARPLAALAELLVGDASQSSSDGSAPEPDSDAVVAALRAEPGLVGVRLRARARRRIERVLLFVDQLEEIYTLAAEEDRAAFFACLSGVADDAGSPLRVILAIRSDFLDRVTEGQAAMTSLSRGLMLLPPMSRGDLRDALVRPLATVDHRFEPPELVEEMLDTLEHTSGALPLLQFTAATLWQQRDRNRRTLTEESYRRIGGVAGTLAGHAEAVLGAMSSEDRRLCRAALLRLVTPERTRAPAARRELCELSANAADMDRVLGRLVDARLLTVEARGEAEATVELVHESLITNWPTLARWVADHHEDAAFLARLHHATREWQSGAGAEDLLWRGQPAEDARRWYERYPGELAGVEERFLRAVIALADRSRRRRRRAIAGALGLSLLVAVGMSSLAWRERRANRLAEEASTKARSEAVHAQAEAARARDAVRLAVAREHQSDPTTVVALLREIEDPNPPQGWSALAKQALDAGVARVVLRGNSFASVSWSPDGRRIASGSGDGAVRVWNADGTGDPLVLRGHAEVVLSVSWSPDSRRIASAARDHTVRVWNADGTGDLLVFRGHTASVLSASWSPDGRRIATASNDRTARVWNADGTGEPTVVRHPAEVNWVSWSPDGRRLATASDDKAVRVWNADGTGAPTVLSGHSKVVHSVAWSPDGRRLVSASPDRTARIWNADGTGDPIVLSGHTDTIRWAGWSPDGRRIASISLDQTVRVWSAESAGAPVVLTGHSGGIWSASWSPDGRRIVSASTDRTLRVWAPDDVSGPLVFPGYGGINATAMWSPDGARVVSASNDERVRVWSADGSGVSIVLAGHTQAVRWASWSPDGRRIASCSNDGTARVWNADGSGKPIVFEHPASVNTVAWSPDGGRIVSASKDWIVRVWSVDGTIPPIALVGHARNVESAMWSPDGARIASASGDTVRVWNADGSGAPIILGHTDGALWAAWSPDGRRIVSASKDGIVRVWNADGTGEPLVLTGHTAPVLMVAFSPDGRRIASAAGSEDRTVRVWSADGAGEPLVLSGHASAITSVDFDRDGARIVTASSDKTVRIWRNLAPVMPGDPRLWAATTYCLPVAERRRLLGTSEELARAEAERCRSRSRAAAAR